VPCDLTRSMSTRRVVHWTVAAPPSQPPSRPNLVCRILRRRDANVKAQVTGLKVSSPKQPYCGACSTTTCAVSAPCVRSSAAGTPADQSVDGEAVPKVMRGGDDTTVRPAAIRGDGPDATRRCARCSSAARFRRCPRRGLGLPGVDSSRCSRNALAVDRNFTAAPAAPGDSYRPGRRDRALARAAGGSRPTAWCVMPTLLVVLRSSTA
jgi:hypothetical protein